jgi:hypothetical protein
MNLTDISKLRLASQQITNPTFNTAKDIVSHMGAIQAQDSAMAKWAVGIRLPKSTEETIEDSINSGEIIRTHILRPTWHLVAAEDIYWMLELTAPRIKASMNSRRNELKFTPAILNKSNKLIEKVLTASKHATRDELISVLKKAKIVVSDSSAYHLFLWAELEGLICSGPLKNKKSTYALLSERAAMTKKISKEEALAKLAKKYFTSHYPTTLGDFTWWSGLSIKEAKQALEQIKPQLVSEKIGEATYWMPTDIIIPKEKKDAAYLLPAFDEFIISYKDRSTILSSEEHQKAVSTNGIFRPVIIINGKIAGLWSRTIKKDKVIITTDFFEPASAKAKKLTAEAGEVFGRFLEKEVEMVY